MYQEDDSAYPYGEPVQKALDYMLKLAETMGFDTYNMDNQLGWCEYGSGEEMVAVLGHLDVVSEGDGWTVPPFNGLVENGRIYGWGTMDDKGSTMAALYGLLAIKESGFALDRRIRLIFGLNEETGSADMKYYAAHGGEVPVLGFTPDGEYPVINGEKGLINEAYRFVFSPDLSLQRKQADCLHLKEIWGGVAHNIVPNQAWVTFACKEELAQEILKLQSDKITCTRTDDGVKIEAEGICAHGGTPWEGENAIGRLLLFITKLPLEEKVQKAVSFLAEKIGMECDGTSLGIAMEDDVSGILTMNLGTIRGKAEYMEVKMNYRYPVTHSFEECEPVVRKAFEEAGFVQSEAGHKKCLYMSPKSELVQKLMKVYEDCTGEKAKPKNIGGVPMPRCFPMYWHLDRFSREMK